jgi:putative endonuclease
MNFSMDIKYFVYAIQSKVDKRLYIGLSKDVEKRVKSHNNGETFSTKGYRPWALVYKEEIGERKQAREREKYLKSGAGKEYIKNKIKYSAIAQW